VLTGKNYATKVSTDNSSGYKKETIKLNPYNPELISVEALVHHVCQEVLLVLE